jgi:hypothetical protein
MTRVDEGLLRLRALRTRELLRRSFKMLERAEGYYAAAANTEQYEPPFRRRKAFEEWVSIRALLADLQKLFGEM